MENGPSLLLGTKERRCETRAFQLSKWIQANIDNTPILFSSLDVVTKILLTLAKYHRSGGTNTRVTGSTATADDNAPSTKNETTRKSNKVVGS